MRLQLPAETVRKRLVVLEVQHVPVYSIQNERLFVGNMAVPSGEHGPPGIPRKYTLSFKGFPHKGFQKGFGPPAENDLPQPWWENTLAKPS